MRVLCIAALCLVGVSAVNTGPDAYNDLGDTGCTDGPTVGLRRMVDWLQANFMGQPWWGSDDGYVRVRTTSLHCAGRAVDWVMDACTSAGRAEGDRIVQTLVANAGRQAKAWGVQTVIWRGKIWTYRENWGERAYSTGAGYLCSQGATSSKTSGHWDHVHLDLNIWGSINFPANAVAGYIPPAAPTPAPRTGHACTNHVGTCELSTSCASPKRTIAGKCPADPSNVLCCYSTTPTCGATFCPGDSVQFTTNVNLRASASTSGTKLRVSTIGETAEVIAGPTSSGGYDFWNLKTYSGNVWAARGDNWFVKYPGAGNLDTAPPQQTIVPSETNTTVYSDICVEGTTKNVSQASFTIQSEGVDSCGKKWYEVQVEGDTNVWYLVFDNNTMVMGLTGSDAEGDPSPADIGLSSAGRTLPLWSLVVVALSALAALRV